MAIALVIMNPTTHTVLSDSKSAILGFMRGSVELNTAKSEKIRSDRKRELRGQQLYVALLLRFEVALEGNRRETVSALSIHQALTSKL
ncbi:hypothetical protein HPB50_028143 [Hyalomma asiaticum]|nr:hypothetical protein HPB50_028143 [Hyalomma asiaticum]